MNRFSMFVIGTLVLGLGGPSASGQVSDALRDRVAQLVEKLGADDEKVRDGAEKSLVDLGPKALPILVELDKLTGERKLRVDRVRSRLESSTEQPNLGASKIELEAKGIRLSEAIQRLQAMSGNTITDLREQAGGDTTNPAFDLKLSGVDFFRALDEISAKAGVTPNYFTGDGSIGLMSGAGEAPVPVEKPMVAYSGPFRIELREIALTREFTTGTGRADIQLEVAWEPRLRPMLLAIKAEGMSITDDRGRKIEPAVNDETDDAVLRPDNPVAEVNLNLRAPERDARELASLAVKAEVTVPAAQRRFVFKNLTAKNEKITQGEIGVTLESTVVDEQVWRVSVIVEYPGGGPAFESYRQGLFNNRLWLQKADGSRFEHNGGFNNTASDGGTLAFEYLFVDVPGKPADYGLVYETPSKILTIPLEFEFKKVPLP
ncbi:MAG: hypothetical protein SFX72_13015 [Isosphaeraceae bacterium]|nr:hypothetical protein [Isosphaeraceae bacterium]